MSLLTALIVKNGSLIKAEINSYHFTIDFSVQSQLEAIIDDKISAGNFVKVAVKPTTVFLGEGGVPKADSQSSCLIHDSLITVGSVLIHIFML